MSFEAKHGTSKSNNFLKQNMELQKFIPETHSKNGSQIADFSLTKCLGDQLLSHRRNHTWQDQPEKEKTQKKFNENGSHWKKLSQDVFLQS